MRAIQVTEFGGPEVLVSTDVPEPVPGPGEAVVQVSYADIIFLDTTLRGGAGQEYFPLRPPYVPGGAIAGTVAAVGAGVDPGLIGRSVASRTKNWGGYAEKALVDAAILVEVPVGLDERDAASLLHDGLTAYALREKVGIHEGETVLVVAAAGGLGILLVQLARNAGAHVIGAARGAAKLEMVTKWGAGAAVDYSEPGWTDHLDQPAVVFDGAGGPLGQAAFEIVAAGGRFSAHGTPAGSFTAADPERARERNITLTGIAEAQVTAAEAVRFTKRALADAAAGLITPVVGQVYALDDVAQAHRALQERTNVGKVLLRI
ncbi:zinc-binding dehydrogenase [Fodinicola feengrottensis]|uniref:Zinc-binding dehydrogenase n=1 Tax=Fodinicola feengrottensis TaxID=435914 RepID=A0ABN2I1F3_9ACTN|nr:zinc-binding dehydrogenase [Fodinicola feengrottensis]